LQLLTIQCARIFFFWHTVYCWWRDSVVRSSVFGWRTFPDLCLICGWQVTTLRVKLSARGQPTQPYIPLGSVGE